MSVKLAITKKVLQEYINILPISYYLKHRVDIGITDLDASYFDRNNGQIMISIKQLNSLKYDNAPSKEQIENDIRCMLYHEVSHAILTPNDNLLIDKMIFNVFEDERIETLLSNYYYGVKFKEFVKRINNYDPVKRPNSLYEYFYYLVRFRDGDEDLLKEVEDIIFKARLINCKKTVIFLDSKGNFYNFKNYQSSIYKLYLKCKDRFKELENKEQKTSKISSKEGETIVAKSPTQNRMEELFKEQEEQVEDNREDKCKEIIISNNKHYKKNTNGNPQNDFEKLKENTSVFKLTWKFDQKKTNKQNTFYKKILEEK